ncbi:MAG TPA: hypothetical protein VJ835_04930 [Fimbriimonadaceae bacterium]|nr:hypothetical protein [Fimbriimonadaceae bacterium]
MVDSTGGPDEELSVPLDEIVWFDFDTDYLRGLEKLYLRHSEIIGPKPSAGLKVTNTEAIRMALVNAVAQQAAITFRIDKESIDAIPIEVEGNYFNYIQLEDGGRPDGAFWLRIDVVKELKMGSDRQIADRYLYDLWQSHKEQT